jgi:DNA polymerase epsilon subunit 1
VQDLVAVRNQLKSRIEKNKAKETFGKRSIGKDPMKFLSDIREYDVPYHCRVCIDTGLRCGKWYRFTLKDRMIFHLEEDKTLVSAPPLNYMSFDIETSKLPLKFPDSKIDMIMMISL